MPEFPWPTHLPVEALREADQYIRFSADAYDGILFGLGEALRMAWYLLRPAPDCDCAVDPYHRWNCHTTPIWAQTIRDLDTNPWTVVTSAGVTSDA